MPRQTVSDAMKTAALRDLAAGDQPAVVAQRYGLGRDLVKQWKRRMSPAVSPPVRLSPPANSRSPSIYVLQAGTLRSGPDGTLAGVAEPGARLDVSGVGSFINRGTRDSPQWERPTAALTGGSP